MFPPANFSLQIASKQTDLIAYKNALHGTFFFLPHTCLICNSKSMARVQYIRQITDILVMSERSC